MARVRIATFNVENLFARYRFRDNIDPQNAARAGFTVNQLAYRDHDDESKELTGAAINDLRAHVLCLQEVEGLDTLKRFRSEYLGGRSAYPYGVVIDGNDPRRIDVAVLSTLPIQSATTWQHVYRSGRYVFSRDCLEVDVELPNGSLLTVYNNHFKSMIGGRAQTRARRRAQVREVRRIIEGRFGSSPGREQFVVAGDFNDYGGAGTSLNDLLTWDQVEDVLGRLPVAERWTHYYAREREYRQLDYILVSRELAERTTRRPSVLRYGLPWRATEYSGERYVGVGDNEPKASDHCPVSFDLEV